MELPWHGSRTVPLMRAGHSNRASLRALSTSRVAGPAAVALLAACWALSRGIDHSFISFSDGVYTYIGSLVAQRGPGILYRPTVLSQPPAMVLLAASLWKLSPHVETIRVGLALLGVATAELTYAVARSLGLSRPAAVAAAGLALSGPIRAQYGGLDGEAILTPLVLLLALAARRSHPAATGVLLGIGFFVKLTWAPFALAGLVAVWRQSGLRAACKTLLVALATSTALYGVAMAAFGWRPLDLATEIVLGESGSGLHAGLLPGIALMTILLWWPFLPLAMASGKAIDRSVYPFLAAGVLSAGFMLKSGTFLSVLDPIEPLIAILAVMGAVELRTHHDSAIARIVLLTCVAGALLHAVSIPAARVGLGVPIPMGAAILNTNDQVLVDRAARALEHASRPAQPVLVNPLIAVVAGRHEVDYQADWFILHALSQHCRGKQSGLCDLWPRMKEAAKRGLAAAVSVDSNVRSFDPSFISQTGIRGRRLLFETRTPPLQIAIYGRPRAGAKTVVK